MILNILAEITSVVIIQHLFERKILHNPHSCIRALLLTAPEAAADEFGARCDEARVHDAADQRDLLGEFADLSLALLAAIVLATAGPSLQSGGRETAWLGNGLRVSPTQRSRLERRLGRSMNLELSGR
jgi:hypothetical protein